MIGFLGSLSVPLLILAGFAVYFVLYFILKLIFRIFLDANTAAIVSNIIIIGPLGFVAGGVIPGLGLGLLTYLFLKSFWVGVVLGGFAGFGLVAYMFVHNK